MKEEVCMSSEESTVAVSIDSEEWPPEARMILSAIHAGEAGPHANRRDKPRTDYQVCAWLRLFSDPDGSAPWKLYTRDAGPRSLGFITPHRLPLGYGGVVEFASPNGHTVKAHCTLFRCRQTVRGWFEGALSFHREQPALGGRPEADPLDYD
jgi:hypothetical protein